MSYPDSSLSSSPSSSPTSSSGDRPILYADDPLVFKKLVYEMRFDEASARYGDFGAFWAGLQFSPGELPAFLDGDAIPQFDVPEP